MGPVYTLATDCDTSVNAASQAFTPINTAFCPHELSWSEYNITLMSTIRRFANRTGFFWFDTAVYHDNDTVMVRHWLDQLHQIFHRSASDLLTPRSMPRIGECSDRVRSRPSEQRLRGAC